MKFKLNRSGFKNGFSLVEVLASIVILSLIITTVLLIFIQSAKTTKTSESMIDATYIAQSEMEEIYAASLLTKYNDREVKIEELGYTKRITSNKLITLEKVASNSDYLIKVKLKDYSEKTSNITFIIVEVYETQDGILRAKMEDILVWGAD